jgi:hypothetical protein
LINLALVEGSLFHRQLQGTEHDDHHAADHDLMLCLRFGRMRLRATLSTPSQHATCKLLAALCAVLCGNNGEACWGKYGSYPLHRSYCHVFLHCIE